MRESVYGRVLSVRAMNVTSVADDANTDGVTINLDQTGRDFRVLSFVLMAGAVTDGVFTAVPQESADGSTGWTDVPADRLQGAAVVDAANEVAEIGVVPNPGVARYVRLRVVSTETTSGGSVSAIALLGSPSSTPIVRS